MSDPVDNVIAEWRAEDAPDELRQAKKLEQLNRLEQQSTNEAGAAEATGMRSDEPVAGESVDLSTESSADLILTAVNIFVPKFFGAHLKLTDSEKAELRKPLIPVLEKYGAMVTMSPEFALAATAAMIYAPKILPEGGLETLLGGGVQEAEQPAPSPAPAAEAKA